MTAAHSIGLQELSDEYFDLLLRSSPFTATTYGIAGHDAEVPDLRASTEREIAGRMADISRRAAALDSLALDETERATRSLLEHFCSSFVNGHEAHAAEWAVSGFGAAWYKVIAVVPKVKLDTPSRAKDYLQRCSKLAGYLDQSRDRLRAGTGDGFTSNTRAVEQAVAQLDAYLSSDIARDPLVQPDPPADVGEEWRDQLNDVVESQVRPAMKAVRDLIDTEIRAAARSDDMCGIMYLPSGLVSYESAVVEHTTTNQTPEQIHEIGLKMCELLREEFKELGGRALDTSDFDEIRRRLRDDASLRYETSEQIVADARRALREAEQVLSAWFGRTHPIPCEVAEMSPAEADTAVLAYYQQPSSDGSRPGRYWINSSHPTLRTRYECETLTFHESVPGHHLQFALAQEQAGLPAFRRFGYLAAYAEGWAMYTERLADEMGLYSSELARFGMLSFDALRAGRLVVDTGIHALGWTRQQAIDFLWDNTASPMTNIVNEVDRYIAWPGQALAYMTGRLEIDGLRTHAERVLGSHFDIKTFHDVVLAGGSIPLTQLALAVERWISRETEGN